MDIRIVMASPSDVQSERELFPRLLDEMNRQMPVDLKLVPWQWETDTYPTFHAEGPQGAIDDLLKLEDCDIFVGVFWKSFGSKVYDGKTGTEHEIALAEKTWLAKGSPCVMLWFREVSSVSETEREQYERVKGFQEQTKSKALQGQYNNLDDFALKIRDAVSLYLRNHFAVIRQCNGHPGPALDTLRKLRRQYAISLTAVWQSRDWTSDELELALTCYEDLSEKARAVLTAGASEFLKRNAFTLVVKGCRTEDTLALARRRDLWPGELPRLDSASINRIKALVQRCEDIALGVFYILLEDVRIRQSGHRDFLDWMEILGRVGELEGARAIVKSLALLEGPIYDDALMILTSSDLDNVRRYLKCQSDLLDPLIHAMENGDSFDLSLEIVKHIDGEGGVMRLNELLVRLVQYAESHPGCAEWINERVQKIGNAIVQLSKGRPMVFSPEVSSESIT